ncbi:hypothetical protein JTB14_012752 [Gonioctena quinquepunctata]|nr:hypothetical protein JTB14_012752 [Gonioctena quinquepunctata]
MRNHSNEKIQTSMVSQELADISVPISTEQDKTIENKYSDLLSSTYLTLEAKYLATNEALQFLVNVLSDISEFKKEYVLKNQQVDISQIGSCVSDCCVRTVIDCDIFGDDSVVKAPAYCSFRRRNMTTPHSK